jgi:hypothetical protein
MPCGSRKQTLEASRTEHLTIVFDRRYRSNKWKRAGV